jgi:hypothetical protein
MKNVLEEICNTSNDPDYGPGRKYYITTRHDYTHVILINTPMPYIKPGTKVIGLAHEPLPFLRGFTPEFIQFLTRLRAKYFVSDIGVSPCISGNSFLTYTCPPTNIPANKSKIMSIMVSFKLVSHGHQYRHILASEKLKTDLPIDIYGNLFRSLGHHDSRIKGEFKSLEPYLYYQFHICIENFVTQSYFSEKIINPLLCETTPVYLGCKTIEATFPTEVIRLKGELLYDMDLLERICADPDKYSKSIKKEHIEPKVNILKNLDSLFRD